MRVKTPAQTVHCFMVYPVNSSSKRCKHGSRHDYPGKQAGVEVCHESTQSKRGVVIDAGKSYFIQPMLEVRINFPGKSDGF